MLMNKVIAVFILIMGLNSYSFSQKDSVYVGDTKPKTPSEPKKESKSKWKEKLIYGGNFGFFFSANGSFIDISPLIGVKITDKLSVSVGPVYNYLSSTNGAYRYSTSIYGGRAQAMYFVLPQLFAQVGIDVLNRNNPFVSDPNSRVNIQNYWVGGGYRQNLGGALSVQASILYNLNQTKLSPYTNPFFSVGFVVGR